MTQPTNIHALLEQATIQLKQGNKNEAQRILAQAVQQDPNNSSAWFGLAIVVADEKKKIDCLKRVLAIKPDHDRAHAMLAQLEAATPIQQSVLPTPLVEVPLTAPPDTPVLEVPPAKTRKQAGVSTREMERKRWNTGLKMLLIGLVFAILVFIVFLTNPKWIPAPVMGISIIVVLILPSLLDRFVGKKIKESRRAGRGAAAEEKIGKLLAELGPNYEVLHDVECEYGNIDHLVIASNGALFMIETKSHRGKVTMQDDMLMVNGRKPEKDFIAQSLRNSFWLRDQIEPFAGKKPWVTAVLVFTNGFVQVRRPVKGVIVTNKKYLLNTIQNAVKRAQALPGVWENRDEIASLLG